MSVFYRQSVTAFGRMMIEESRRIVEASYTIEKGYPVDATVKFTYLLLKHVEILSF